MEHLVHAFGVYRAQLFATTLGRCHILEWDATQRKLQPAKKSLVDKLSNLFAASFFVLMVLRFCMSVLQTESMVKILSTFIFFLATANAWVIGFISNFKAKDISHFYNNALDWICRDKRLKKKIDQGLPLLVIN